MRLTMRDAALWLGCMVACTAACKVHAQGTTQASTTYTAAGCLPDGSGYFRARLSGVLAAELDWGDQELQCTGAVRPTDQGVRMRFVAHMADGERLAIVIGIARLSEGRSAKAVPVNVTLIREGLGQFYGTQGDDKCMLDQVTQHPLVGIPNRVRLYRVVARGFCVEPARAVRGRGSILISRFDYAGRVDFGEPAPEPTQVPGPAPAHPSTAPQGMLPDHPPSTKPPR